MSEDGVAILEREVRELVRRRGLDPVQDAAGFRALVDEAQADYSDRSTRGVVPALDDPGAAARTVRDAVGGLGPLQRYLDDPDVEEVWINNPAQVFVARAGRPELTTTILTPEQVRDLVERMLKASGRRLDLSSPFVDACLPGGERLHVVIPDVTRDSWAVNLRKHVVRASSLDDLVRLGSLTQHSAAFLDAAVRAGLNLLVAGGTQAGKTTMLNALAGSIPASERVLSCEEVFELKLPVRDWVAMQCRQAGLEGTGEIPLRRLVKEALRMRPDRIVIGEVREAEAFDLLVALNAGVPGMCTVHANSAREAVTKMTTLPLLAGENVSDRFVVPTVASAIDVVVHLGVDSVGRRTVREIVAVTGRVEEGRVECATIFRHDGAALRRADGFPPHPERFARTGVDVAALLAEPLRARPGHSAEPARPASPWLSGVPAESGMR
ncbi:Flp pilus assembly complex ATPase component TadA [Antribacter sp. KLBMP9083]|uniref:Flp pilus assembly complex ATPase component TadA n=1 Tax=Antribacter soli TaxID=2910976 RepID=A0AA41UA61_9MICO|nr:ATPase, T2SS/T4P/T4SS family [Antribacter soli]MCF4119819.1 Flp pilus assembly complex ATPase component TadA [Antribacter soli]